MLASAAPKVPDEVDALLFLFSHEARAQKADCTLAHIMVNCMAVTLGSPRDSNHIYIRAFDVGWIPIWRSEEDIDFMFLYPPAQNSPCGYRRPITFANNQVSSTSVALTSTLGVYALVRDELGRCAPTHKHNLACSALLCRPGHRC